MMASFSSTRLKGSSTAVVTMLKMVCTMAMPKVLAGWSKKEKWNTALRP